MSIEAHNRRCACDDFFSGKWFCKAIKPFVRKTAHKITESVRQRMGQHFIDVSLSYKLTFFSNEPLTAKFAKMTANEHKIANHHSFFKDLANGNVSRREYIDYLRNLRSYFNALENSVAITFRLKCLYQENISRIKVIKLDLKALNVKNDNLDNLNSTEYSKYIWDLKARAPYLIIAHVYASVLGVLSGGQIIKKAISSVQLPTNFYEFDTDNIKTLKEEYRQKIESIPLSNMETQNLLMESIVAFRLFVSLAPRK